MSSYEHVDVPTDIVEAFAELNATAAAVMDVVEDIITRKEALTERINATPELCDNGKCGNASGDVMYSAGWMEFEERLELVAARIGEQGLLEAGVVLPVPDWYVRRQEREEDLARHVHKIEASARTRIEALERLVFDLTTGDAT